MHLFRDGQGYVRHHNAVIRGWTSVKLPEDTSLGHHMRANVERVVVGILTRESYLRVIDDVALRFRDILNPRGLMTWHFYCCDIFLLSRVL